MNHFRTHHCSRLKEAMPLNWFLVLPNPERCHAVKQSHITLSSTTIKKWSLLLQKLNNQQASEHNNNINYTDRTFFNIVSFFVYYSIWIINLYSKVIQVFFLLGKLFARNTHNPKFCFIHPTHLATSPTDYLINSLANHGYNLMTPVTLVAKNVFERTRR